MFLKNYGKYRAVIISITLFILLDASVLGLNFFISYQFSKDTVAINLAGRQRMLSQRTTKALFDVVNRIEQNESFDEPLNELKSAVYLFDSSLQAFDIGGLVTSADGIEVVIDAVNSAAARQAIEVAKTDWIPYKKLLTPLLDDYNLGDSLAYYQAASAALKYSKQNNVSLLKLMNTLTVDIEQVASAKATRLRYIQVGGICLAIINFIIILVHFIGQLRQTDEQLEEANKQTTDILSTVTEGLFLVDDKLKIGSEYSDNMREIFHRDDIGELEFTSLLRGLVTDKVLQTSVDFVKLLFSKKVNENLIGDLNPLDRVEINIEDNQGGFITKYLEFDFNRVQREKGLAHVLITVKDISELVKLEQAIQKQDEHALQQMDILTGILHVQPALLSEFMSKAKVKAKDINNALRRPAKVTADYRSKIDTIFIHVHTVKGDAGAIGLQFLVTKAHELEDELDLISKMAEISGNDFLTLTIKFDAFLNALQSIDEITRRMSDIRSDLVATEKIESLPQDNCWAKINKTLEQIKQQTGKKISLVNHNFIQTKLPQSQQSMVEDALIQLVRNAAFHGIESSEQRVKDKKSPWGSIQLFVEQKDDELQLGVRDDGRGLDSTLIRSKAKKLKLWSEDEVDSWSDKKAASKIFHPSFSTSDDVNHSAGRGVGMGVVNQSVKKCGGRLTVYSKRGLGCEFRICLPLNETSALQSA